MLLSTAVCLGVTVFAGVQGDTAVLAKQPNQTVVKKVLISSKAFEGCVGVICYPFGKTKPVAMESHTPCVKPKDKKQQNAGRVCDINKNTRYIAVPVNFTVTFKSKKPSLTEIKKTLDASVEVYFERTKKFIHQQYNSPVDFLNPDGYACKQLKKCFKSAIFDSEIELGKKVYVATVPILSGRFLQLLVFSYDLPFNVGKTTTTWCGSLSAKWQGGL